MVDERTKEQDADKVVSSLDELYNEPRANAEDSTGLGVKLNSGQEKIKYLRVPGMGSVEAYELDNGDWAVKRRDKL